MYLGQVGGKPGGFVVRTQPMNGRLKLKTDQYLGLVAQYVDQKGYMKCCLNLPNNTLIFSKFFQNL
jgi:hypothetical protein